MNSYTNNLFDHIVKIWLYKICAPFPHPNYTSVFAIYTDLAIEINDSIDSQVNIQSFEC